MTPSPRCGPPSLSCTRFERQPGNPGTLESIQELKDSLARFPEAPRCPKGEAADSPTGIGFPQGTFKTTISQDDWGEMEGQPMEFSMMIDAETVTILDVPTVRSGSRARTRHSVTASR
jgi:hypothetical protein